jgi:hypothetical protein
MLSSFTRAFKIQIIVSRLAGSSPFEWNHFDNNLKLLQSRFEKSVSNFISRVQFVFISIIVFVHLSLSLKEVETYTVSLAFTIFILACGLMKYMLERKSKEIRTLYNSLSLYEKCFLAGSFSFIKALILLLIKCKNLRNWSVFNSRNKKLNKQQDYSLLHKDVFARLL